MRIQWVGGTSHKGNMIDERQLERLALRGGGCEGTAMGWGALSRVAAAACSLGRQPSVSYTSQDDTPPRTSGFFLPTPSTPWEVALSDGGGRRI